MQDESSVGVAEPVVIPQRKKNLHQDHRPQRQPPFHVILWNDEDHSYGYVMDMLQSLFGHPLEKGFQLAEKVDIHGRVIVLTTTKEHAELKRDQIHAYGKDGLIDNCQGSMSASIEASE